jgi:hypothetical protein
MERRRWWIWVVAGVAVLALAVVAWLVWGGDDEDDVTTGSTTTSTGSTTTSVGSTTSTTAGTTSTETSTTPPGQVPGTVGVIRVAPGGGSGEVEVDWDAVAQATGYRVLRSSTTAGPWVTVADLDVTTGHTTAVGQVVNLWSVQHSYIPDSGELTSPDTSPSFQYVEVSGTGSRCFRVLAYNAAGDGAASTVACGSPP